jgi:hypothetical protein
VANIHVPKMGEADDAEAFLENFQAVAEVSGWPRQEWAHRLLPLLTGEAQLANHSLPAGAQQDYGTIARAIQDRLGLYPEEHRRRFRTLAFTEGDRPFAFAQQLRGQARRWLVPDQNSAEDVVEQVAQERFVEGLPTRTSAWVWQHLSAAVDLAESHLQPPPTAQRPPTPVPHTGAADLCRDRPSSAPRARGGSPFRSGHINHLPPPLRRRALRRQGRVVGGAGGLVTSGAL